MEPHQETGHPLHQRQCRSFDEDNRYVKVLPTSFHCHVCHVSHCHECHVNDLRMPVSGARGRTEADIKEDTDMRNEVQDLTRNLVSCTKERDYYKDQLDAREEESRAFLQRIEVFMMNIKDLNIMEGTNIMIGDGNTMEVIEENLPEVFTKLMELKKELDTANLSLEELRDGVKTLTVSMDKGHTKAETIKACVLELKDLVSERPELKVYRECLHSLRGLKDNTKFQQGQFTFDDLPDQHARNGLKRMTATLDESMWKEAAVRFGVNKETIPATETDQTKRTRTIYAHLLYQWVCREPDKTEEDLIDIIEGLQLEKNRETRKRLEAAMKPKFKPVPPRDTKQLQEVDTKVSQMVPMVKQILDQMNRFGEERSMLKMEELLVNEQTKTFVEEEIDAGDVAEEGLNKDTTPTTLSTPSHRIKISLVRGRMAEQKVDVMVHSTGPNTELLGRGQLSKSLAKAGGDSLKMHCTKRFPEGISVGSMGVTPGGDLKCQILIHVCLTRWEEDEHISKQLMAKLIDDCLAEAETRGYASIAFPALGTGYLEYPPKVVAELMFDRIQVFEIDNPLSTVHDVSLVIFPSNTNVIAAFEDASQDRR